MSRSGPRNLWGGRVRVSTVALSVAFLAVLTLYLLVRPEPVDPDSSEEFTTPSAPREPARHHRPHTERRDATPRPTAISPAGTPSTGPTTDPDTDSPKPAPTTSPPAPAPSGSAPVDTPKPRGLLHLLAPTPTP